MHTQLVEAENRAEMATRLLKEIQAERLVGIGPVLKK